MPEPDEDLQGIFRRYFSDSETTTGGTRNTEDLHIKKIQLNNLSSPKTRTVGSCYLAVDSVSQEQLLSQLARFGIQDEPEPEGDPLINSLSEPVYHPDDVFNSDDSFEC